MNNYHAYRYVTRKNRSAQPVRKGELPAKAGILAGLTVLDALLDTRPRTYNARGRNGRHRRKYRL